MSEQTQEKENEQQQSANSDNIPERPNLSTDSSAPEMAGNQENEQDQFQNDDNILINLNPSTNSSISEKAAQQDNEQDQSANSDNILNSPKPSTDPSTSEMEVNQENEQDQIGNSDNILERLNLSTDPSTSEMEVNQENEQDQSGNSEHIPDSQNPSTTPSISEKAGKQDNEQDQSGNRDNIVDSLNEAATPGTTKQASDLIKQGDGLSQESSPGTKGPIKQETNDQSATPTASKSGSSLDEDIYDTKGKGLCVIMANFIPEGATPYDTFPVLPGYKHDITNLEQLFKKKMFDFDVKSDSSWRNLSCKQFRKALQDIRTLLEGKSKKEESRYDKFIMFVLSHGGENGISMCEEGSNGLRTEKHDEENVAISPEEIINTFTHDRQPYLKGVPKCFFFQACRGTGSTRGAAQEETELTPDEKSNRLLLPSLANKDMLVVYPTLSATVSYVDDDNGSWFIYNLVQVLKEKSEEKNLIEMLQIMTGKTTDDKDFQQWFYFKDRQNEIKIDWDDGHYPATVCGKLKDDKQNEYKPLVLDHPSYHQDMETVFKINCGDGTVKTVNPSEIKNASVFVKGRFYGSGTVERHNNRTWGVRVKVYQLPFFTSTMAKSLHLAKIYTKIEDQRKQFQKIKAAMRKKVQKFEEDLEEELL